MKTVSVIVAVVILEIAVALTLVPLATPARLKTTDFVNFYVGASIVRQGGSAHLYNREVQDAAYQSIVGYQSNQYFLHPPFEAAALVPLTLLTLEQAFVAWMLISVALLGCLPLLLMPCVPFLCRRPQWALLGFSFLPVLIALNLGQDSILLLFILSASYMLMFKGKDFVAGLVLAVAAIKFQYLVILIPLLLFSRRFRLIGGIASGGGLLAVVSLFVVGPRGLWEYFAFLRDFNAHGGYGGLNPALMVNARGFLTGLGCTTHALVYGAIVGFMLFALAAFHLSRGEGVAGLRFALCITIALVASPYAHFPDMTLLLLPMILVIDRVIAKDSRNPKLIAFTCAALFLTPYVLLSRGRYYWWDSQIYLLFLVILLFAGPLALELTDHSAEADSIRA